MKKRDYLFIMSCLTGFICVQSQEKQDSITNLSNVVILGKVPISKEQVKKDQIEKKNLGQDVPYLLKNNLSIVSSSDTGNGVGYTNMRIRGNDQNRINLTLNGVPVNNAESQGPFWINMPDLASSMSSITIQRGVGTTTEGVGSFGASINVKTQEPSNSPYFQTDQSIGSFNTHKHTFGIGTGNLLNDQLKIDARVSFIKSDGYVDRAYSDLFSYYTHAVFKKNKTRIGALVFGGKEQTYQAWNGIDEETLKKRRTFNTSGAIYGSNGEIVRFYDNQIDHYLQNHYHLYLDQEINSIWQLKSTIFYTKGKGYFEEYGQNSKLNDYKLAPININGITINETDLIRQQWLNNDFYGIVNSLLGFYKRWTIELGLGANIYQGQHYGKVIWAQNFSDQINGHEYYRNKAKKEDLSTYAKAIYKLNKKWEFFGDIQYRFINYEGHDVPGGESLYKNGGELNFDKNYNFLNPKVGTTYKLEKGDIYFTYGIAQREPTRDDILNNKDIKHELMHNVEVGLRKNTLPFSYTVNCYGMYYLNQLVLSGAVNDVGSFIRENSGKSYRTGIELSASYLVNTKLLLSANSTVSINKNINYKKEEGLYTVDLGNTDLAFSPNYIGNLIIEWKPIKNLSATLSNQYVSSQYLTNENQKNAKLDGYFTSDIVIQYSPTLPKLKDFSLKLALNNIFNATYINNGYYYDNVAYYYPQAGFNILTGISLRL